MAASPPRRSPGFRSLARNHDFTVLWIGQTISDLGTRVSSFVFPLVAYAMTHSAFWAATAEAAHMLGMVAMLLPAGVLADRCDRRRLMRGASAAGLLLYGSLAVAGLADALTVPHLLVVALLTGVAAGLFAPAETSAVRSVVPADDLPAALSQQQARQHVANLLGAPLGGALLGVTRWLPFAFDAVTYALSWVLLGRIRTPLAPVASAPAKPLAHLVEGIRFTWSVPFFRVGLLWAPAVNLVSNALFFVALLRMVEAGVAPTTIALVEVAAGIAGILGALIAPWLIERVPTGLLVVAVAWSQVPLIIPIAIWNDPVVIGAGLSLILLLNPAGNAGVGAYRIAITPPELLGRTQSAMQFMSMSTMPFFPLLAGALLALLGGREAVLAMGALVALTALIPTLSRSVREVPRPAVWRVHRNVAEGALVAADTRS